VAEEYATIEGYKIFYRREGEQGLPVKTRPGPSFGRISNRQNTTVRNVDLRLHRRQPVAALPHNAARRRAGSQPAGALASVP
jgi:hypothetical protein